MKHIRHDRTFIYYFRRRTDGTFVGIRVGRGLAWIIEGESKNPEMLTVRGNPEKVPMAGEGSHEFAAILQMLAPPNSELDRLLSGQLRFADALSVSE
jgi:hypothetical protein